VHWLILLAHAIFFRLVTGMNAETFLAMQQRKTHKVQNRKKRKKTASKTVSHIHCTA